MMQMEETVSPEMVRLKTNMGKVKIYLTLTRDWIFNSLMWQAVCWHLDGVWWESKTLRRKALVVLGLPSVGGEIQTTRAFLFFT